MYKGLDIEHVFSFVFV